MGNPADNINPAPKPQITLPDIEIVSAKVHEDWIKQKQSKGVTTRLSTSGEELMVPYDQLSEEAKDLDRDTVKVIYAAIRAV